MAQAKHPTPDPPAPAPSGTTLPAERAFVVQLRADADLARGVVRGRLEHVLSGVAALFDSAEQLVRCMRDTVVRSAKPTRRGLPRSSVRAEGAQE